MTMTTILTLAAGAGTPTLGFIIYRLFFKPQARLEKNIETVEGKLEIRLGSVEGKLKTIESDLEGKLETADDKLAVRLTTVEASLKSDELIIQSNKQAIVQQIALGERIENSITKAMAEMKELIKGSTTPNDVKVISAEAGEVHKKACHAEVQIHIHNAIADHEKRCH